MGLILQVIGIAFVGVVAYSILKTMKPEMSIYILISTGILIMVLILPQIGEAVNLIRELAEKSGLEMFYITTTFKIIAICYLTTIASEICKDAGAATIGSKVELAGKVIILLLAVPIIYGLLDTIVKLL